jgi:DNA-binding HxlR family transcriptional regulator
MRRKSFGDMQCPIARSLERVGEWWSMLILRDASLGLTRFDQFEESLGIAPNMLTRRLKGLVEAGLLERRRYSDRPPRYEYVLTQAGRDFRPVLWAFLAWGNMHFAPEGASVVIVDSKTGALADPMLVDRISGRPLMPPDFRSAPGPAANARTRRHHRLPAQPSWHRGRASDQSRPGSAS